MFKNQIRECDKCNTINCICQTCEVNICTYINCNDTTGKSKTSSCSGYIDWLTKLTSKDNVSR